MFNFKLFLFVILVNLLKSAVIKADGSISNSSLSNEEYLSSLKHGLPIFDIRVDKLSAACQNLAIPHDCDSATKCTKRSGIYKIQIPQLCKQPPFLVFCDARTAHGGWLVIQRRQDGSQDFFRNWADYENGFGVVDGEFFIGLKKLYALTNLNGPQELMVVLQDAHGIAAYAKYDSFAIGDASESYKLKRLGRYSGTAGNSLSYHVNMKFTTRDNDNDLDSNYNCAQRFTGAWWYASCHTSNLNGKYGDHRFGMGVTWLGFRGHSVSLPYAVMMIRRSRLV